MIFKYIIEYDVLINKILEQGKNFSCTKSKVCPCCDDNLLWDEEEENVF